MYFNVPLFKTAQFYGAAAGVGAASSASGYPMAAAAAAYGAVAANHHQSGHQQHNSHHQVRGLRISLLMPLIVAILAIAFPRK